MKKLSAIVIFLASIAILFFISALLFIDYRAAYIKFLSNLNPEFSSSQISEVELIKFPLPYLKIKSLQLEQKANIEDLEIKFFPLSLLKFSPQISNLNAKKINIKLVGEETKFGLINHHKVISTILQKGFVGMNIHIEDLVFTNQHGNNLLSINDFSFTHSKKFKGTYNNIDFRGTLSTKEGQGNFELIVNSPNVNIVENYENFVLSTGQAKVKISDLQYLLNYFIPNMNNIFTNINSQEVIDINLEITNQDDFLTFKNIVINAPGDATKGQGEIKLNNNGVADEINFNFSKVSLNTKNKQSQNPQATSRKYTQSAEFILNNKTAVINVVIDELLFNNQKMTSINCSAQLDKNTLNITNFSGNIGTAGNFLIEGNVTNNDYRSIFEGNINVVHDNFNEILALLGYQQDKKDISLTTSSSLAFSLSAKIRFSPIDLYLQDILFKTPTSRVAGQLAIKFIGAVPRINSTLEFSLLDLDKVRYPIISPVMDFIFSLTQGMKEEGYLSKFIPIRTLSYMGNFDFTFNDIIVFGNNFNKVNLLLDMIPSKIQVENIYALTNDNNFFSAKILLNATTLKPLLTVTINDAVWPIKFLRPGLIEDFRSYLIKNASLDKIILKLDGKISKIYQDVLEINNLIFKVQNDNILFKILNLEADIFGGKLTANGSILLDPYTFNFVYAFNSIDLGLLSKTLPKAAFINDQGNLSINGMLTTNGDNLAKLLYNFYLKSHFISKGIKINNFSLDELIKNVNKAKYNVSVLNNDIKKALLTGSNVLDILEGDVEVNKGFISLKDMKFSTPFSAGAAAATINIYSFDLNLSSIFSFYCNNQAMQKATVRLPIKATGNFFQPNKTADATELEKALLARSVR